MSGRASIVVCLLLRALCGPAAHAQTAQKPAEPAGEPRVRFVWKDHPSLRVGKALRIDFRARIGLLTTRSDATVSDDEAGAFDLVRRRIGIDGELGRYAEFQVEGELKDNNGDPWRDVFLNYRQFTAVQIQAGKFKLPFSLDENTSAANLDFVYRSRVAALLAPGRDRGVMLHGRLLRRTLEYEAGVFEHDGDNARTAAGDRTFGDRTIAARLAIEPFRPLKSPLEDFHVGVAFTTSDVPVGFPGLRGRTALDQGFYASKVWVNGTRTRMGLEVRVRPGPASIKAEIIRAMDERLGQSVEDGDLSRFLAQGWYVSATCAITGDSKSKGLDQPAHPVFQGGIGAIELAARIEQLEFGSDGGLGTPSTSPRSDNVDGNADRAVTVGVSWYLNRWIKIQGNAIREEISDPSRGPSPGKNPFWSRVLRLQFVI